MSWQQRNTASNAQPRVTRSTDCYLSSMRRRRNLYHVAGTMWPTDPNAVGIKRQLKPNSNPPHPNEKTEIKQLGVIHTTLSRTWTVEQNIPNRSTDHEDVPRHATSATYSDGTSLVMLGPKTADGLHLSYVATWPNIEAPHTHSASLTKK